MPICQSCKRKWSWVDSIKKLLTFRKSMQCNHCGEIQYQSTSSRNATSLLVLLPISIIPLSIMFDLSPISVLLLGLALMLVALFVMPLLLKLTNKEEPLW
ncbi:TIGR04104 family putative zinc finger protein [Bacillus sp. FJAT-27225]|uniref:TIGR04104 family putative zinc finger protein n=1 Tax=Bacillus sp. FJAT-27225 TaxID=1743144 RepID=UPI000980C6DA|nr:TIGR04104 family putative zinc finger protein [Bacillus sp. FJAT-27225]